MRCIESYYGDAKSQQLHAAIRKQSQEIVENVCPMTAVVAVVARRICNHKLARISVTVAI